MENNLRTKNSALRPQDGLEQTIDLSTNPANDNNINIINNQENKNISMEMFFISMHLPSKIFSLLT